jgi:CheY-like chemotaxis protein
MLSIVSWLEEIEGCAAELYTVAARYFEADQAFSAFLQQLAEEEQWHRRLIGSQLPDREHDPAEAALFTLDEETRAKISGLFTDGLARLAVGEMSREAMLETIAVAEFSEWNDIFLYALHLLQGNSREYQTVSAEIERHKEEIARFLAAEPDGRRFLETVQQLPTLAGKRILIIENQPALAKLLRSIVATVGEVHLVESGPEGLARIEKEDFDVVIANINLPAMSSLEFYTRVIARNPEMKERFVFFAGAALKDNPKASATGEATLLTVPAMISHLRRAVAGIAHKSRVFH